ncbi:MAG: FAD-dependent oxidoreductase, partial [Gammaproteobacteria bacterium]
MKPLVIIGTGLGGYSLAREVRKLDPDLALVLISADDGRYYSKPLLSNAYTSGKTPEAIANADAAAMAKQLNAEVRPWTTVTAVDPAAHTVSTGDQALEYQKLVFALGADPIRLAVSGTAQGRIMSINDLIDYTKFRTAVQGVRRVAIMGAGLIGCEFANDLHQGGITAEVIDPAPYPLSRFLPEVAGRTLRKALTDALGVAWHLGQVVASLDYAAGNLAVTLSDHRVLGVDAVLSSVGLRPRTGLAEGAGIAVKRGIVVDRYLATSAPDVYALGDCAEVEGLVLPFVMPIMHAARALAKTLCGEQPTRLTYPAMPIVVKTTAYPVVVAPPAAEVDGAWQVDDLGSGLRALFHGPDRSLAGFALTGTAVSEKNSLAKELPPV